MIKIDLKATDEEIQKVVDAFANLKQKFISAGFAEKSAEEFCVEFSKVWLFKAHIDYEAEVNRRLIEKSKNQRAAKRARVKC